MYFKPLWYNKKTCIKGDREKLLLYIIIVNLEHNGQLHTVLEVYSELE